MVLELTEQIYWASEVKDMLNQLGFSYLCDSEQVNLLHNRNLIVKDYMINIYSISLVIHYENKSIQIY